MVFGIMRDQAPSPSIRSRLLLLVLAATLPVLAYSAFLLQQAYRGSAALVEQTAAVNVRRLALAVDAQVDRAEAVVLALSDLPLLDQPNPAEFDATATHALAAAGLHGYVTLVGVDGHTAGSLPNAPAHLPDPADRQRVFQAGVPQVSGVYPDPDSKQPYVAIQMPVSRGGKILYDAVIALAADNIVAALLPRILPDGWSASVVDRDNRLIARSFGPPSLIGQPLISSIAALVSNRQDGFGRALSREGDPLLVAFTHAANTGWLVDIGVPEADVRAPRVRSIAALIAGGGILVLASAGLAWLIGRRIAGPVHALAIEAARLGREELPNPNATKGIAEAEAAGHALYQAMQLLLARNQEREAALRRAEESEARLLLAQEAGKIGAWETDCATGHRIWSQQQYALYGVDLNEEPPHRDAWSKLIHPDDRARVMGKVSRSYAQPMSYQHEFRIIQPGGAVRWLRSAGLSQFKNGKPLRLLGITLDTTERHESERALREGAARLEAEVFARTRELAESEARFRTYFDHSGDALLVIRVEQDRRFVLETLNKAAERLTGLRAKEIAGRTPDQVMLPETADAVLESLQQVADRGAPLRLQQTLTFPTGTLELETVLVPVWDPAANRIGRIISGQRDLAEQRRIESRLAHAQRLEAVGQLTGGVAHDFNNLLTVVIGNLSLLRRRLGHDERAARYLTSVETAAQRGAKLTASLLAFSRRQRLQVMPIDVGAQLRESDTLLRRALGEEIVFSLEVQPSLPLAIADAAQLEAAVLNLTINARDAIMQAMAANGVRGGVLRIRVQQATLSPEDLEGNDEAEPGPFVAIEVQDTGAGMTPEVRARAFEPFFTTKEVGQGTGLGLSQVFGFVRQLGGHVTLDSREGQGTRAVLYLQAAAAEQRVAAEAPEPPPLPSGAAVLVVEDDDSIREITAEVLRDVGLHVLVAPDGPAALEILESSARVDVLFSDVVMPGGATGVDLAHAAHRLRPSLSILLTSGYGGPALSRYGADGEFDVLAKPYTRAVLLERLAGILAAMQPT